METRAAILLIIFLITIVPVYADDCDCLRIEPCSLEFRMPLNDEPVIEYITFHNDADYPLYIEFDIPPHEAEWKPLTPETIIIPPHDKIDVPISSGVEFPPYLEGGYSYIVPLRVENYLNMDFCGLRYLFTHLEIESVGVSEFPSPFLPGILIIGMLCAVILILRIRH